MKINLKVSKEFDVKYLVVSAGVRYWEDAKVNNKEDSDGLLMPFRNGEYWEPIINIETGIVKDWPNDKAAEIHYKICDDGRYTLLDENFDLIKAREGYVPSIMCPDEEGYGDYIIMSIDCNGQISNWNINDLEKFISEEEY